MLKNLQKLFVQILLQFLNDFHTIFKNIFRDNVEGWGRPSLDIETYIYICQTMWKLESSIDSEAIK